MGRSGGGGGSHSSGGFGGGHSSGGFSSSSRHSSSSHSRSSSSYRSSYSRPRSSHGPVRSRGYYGGYGPRTVVYRRSSTLSSVLAFMIVVMIIVIVAFATIRGDSSSVPANTKERTALSGVVSKTDWYKDELNWVRSKNDLIDGLEDFYNETGVQPYIVLVSYQPDLWQGQTLITSKADTYLENIYNKTFKDEGHFIFAYFSCPNDSRSEMDGEFRYLSGYRADTIMDNEALRILWAHFENNYYNTSLSMEDMFSRTFSQTANSIMSSPTNGWDFMRVAIIVVGVIAFIIIVYAIMKLKAKRAKEKEEYTKEILDKPLETFGSDTSELEEKYK